MLSVVITTDETPLPVLVRCSVSVPLEDGCGAPALANVALYSTGGLLAACRTLEAWRSGRMILVNGWEGQQVGARAACSCSPEGTEITREGLESMRSAGCTGSGEGDGFSFPRFIGNVSAGRPATEAIAGMFGIL
jgi:hypothetical protein